MNTWNVIPPSQSSNDQPCTACPDSVSRRFVRLNPTEFCFSAPPFPSLKHQSRLHSTAAYFHRRHAQDSPQMSSDTSCEFCKNIFNEAGKYRLALDFDMFHTHCETCPPEEEQDELCAMCRHLNLGHLLFCPISEKPAFKVVLGSSSVIDRVRDCAFHRVLQSAVRAKESMGDQAPEYALSIETMGQWSFVLFPVCGIHSHQDWYRSEIVVFHPDASAARRSLDEVITQGSVQEMIDWNRVNRWTASCGKSEGGHSYCHTLDGAGSAVLPKGFRVVDVNERRLVHPDSDVRFVALSYVWGKHRETNLVTNKDNFDEFQQKGSLKAKNMPRTIEDAIQVCRRLGERYLWVDRLSIIQNDPNDKEDNIGSMAAIYTRAAFTIVVACGDNMDVQIPGVSLKRRALTKVCTIGTARLVYSCPDFAQLLGSSTWETRGWTFQEKILSRCKLFITPIQLAWSCGEGLIHEDNTSNEDPMRVLDNQVDPFYHHDSLFTQNERGNDDREARDFTAYVRHSKTYSCRNLSDEDDIYNAFSGILAALYPAGEKLSSTTYGLPLRHIDAALLWHHQFARKNTIRTSAKTLIPSWSWLSISGAVSFLSFCGTLVKWSLIFAQDPTISLELKGDQTPSFVSFGKFQPWVAANGEEFKGDSFPPSIYMSLAVSQGCLDLTTQADGGRMFRETPFEELVERCTMRWPTYTSYWEEMFGSSTSDPVDHVVSNDETWLLRTRAQTATLRIPTHAHHHMSPYDSYYCLNGFQILSSSGKLIGTAPAAPLLDVFVTSKATNGMAQADTDKLSVAPDIKAMAISMGAVRYSLGCHVAEEYTLVNPFDEETELLEHTSYQDNTGRWGDPVPVVNVMFIGEWEGHWRRLGIGRVLLRRWVELEREMETITLW
jgi:hypothetical protein